MKSYSLAEIKWGDNWIVLTCLDSDVMAKIIADVKKDNPSTKIKNNHKLISGETFSCTLTKLKFPTEIVGYGIVKKMCLSGWEPFATTSLRNDLLPVISLRRSLSV